MEAAGAVRLQQLRDQQARWMRERQAELDREHVMAGMGHAALQAFHTPHAPPPDALAAAAPAGHIVSSSGTGPGPPAPVLRPEDVIDKLTERITDRLRSELRVELQRETLGMASQAAARAARDDAFLARELEAQNTCPICYELMVPPRRCPQLLFPCGHTFCAACINAHTEQHHRGHCPVCRKKIESKALNYPLQQLIMNWVARRGGGPAGGGAGVGLVGGEPAGPSLVSAEGAAAAASTEETSAEQILRKNEQVGLRLRVLRNELLDVMAEQEAVQAREAALGAVSKHLNHEEQRVKARLAEVQKEWDLLQARQQEHADKARRLADQASRVAAARALLVATITPLEEEEEKLQLLAKGLREGPPGL